MHDATDPVPGGQDAAIAFLADPATHGGALVRRIDTHCSVVFLTGEHAFKLKRAIRYPYLDYSTLERRQRACEDEVALNRRTAPALYLGTLTVTKDAGGSLHLGGDGEVVEWLVQMRRFPDDSSFDRMAERGLLTDALMDATADTIAAFHDRAEVRTETAAGASLMEIVAENAVLLGQAPPAVVDQDAVRAFNQAATAAAAQQRSLLEVRRERGKVRRCHGDLHLRNLCQFENRPTLFDAIEFDERLATIDVLYDLAFLLMDLWHRGLYPQANRLLNRYIDRTGDIAGLAALPLFLSTRAAIRAHVALAASARAAEKSRHYAEARQYLDLAISFLQPQRPSLLAIGGLSGTGKTIQARRIAPSLGNPPGALIRRSDVTRKRILGVAETTRLPPAGYTPEVTHRVYRTLLEEAEVGLRAGQAVVIDAACARLEERTALAALAEELCVPFHGVWLQAPLDVRLARVGTRTGDASDATTTVVHQQDTREVGPLAWPRIDAGHSAAETTEAIVAAISRSEG